MNKDRYKIVHLISCHGITRMIISSSFIELMKATNFAQANDRIHKIVL